MVKCMKVVEKLTKNVLEVEDREDFYLHTNGITELKKENYTPLIDKITSLDEYQKLAARTLPDLTEFYGSELTDGLNCNEIHCSFGVDSELGEIVDLYKKSYAYRRKFDKVNLLEEICDIMWYLAGLCTINYRNLSILIDLDTIIFTGNYIPTDEYPTNENMMNTINVIYDYRLGNIEIGELLIELVESKEHLLKGLTSNINKLIIRYPDKFSSKEAINRNLEKERNQLEQ